MDRLLILYTVLCFCSCSGLRGCGPNNACECSQGDFFVSMKCFDTGVSLNEICSYIGNEENITSFSATGYDIPNLYKTNLTGCETLQELVLGQNAMIHIEEGIFDSFDHLDLLDLSFNNLDVFVMGYKFGLSPKLRVLKLNGNIESQSSSGFYPDFVGNSLLEVLYIDGIPNASFPQGYLMLRNLSTLSLSGFNGYCSLVSLSNNTFQYLVMLKHVNISSCDIQTVEAETFKVLPSLETLDISNNIQMGFPLLTNISYGLQFTNIKSLNYSHVYPTFGLGNEIKMQDVCFLWNTSLTELILDSNRMELIETNALILLPEPLKIISVNDNIFSFGQYMLQLGCMPNVTKFYGSFQNKLHQPNRESRYNGANYIDKIYNRDCPYMQMDVLKNISKSIDICNFFSSPNTLSAFPTLPRHLEVLLFNDCNMKFEIEELLILPTDNHLKHMDMSGNTLYSWKGPLGPFPHVSYLDLSRNYCYNIEQSFFGSFPSVETLLIDRNLIGFLLVNDEKSKYIFSQLSYLKKLNMSSNRITHLPSALLANNVNLEVLDLSMNNIEKWTIDTTGLNNLAHINLSFNSVGVLPEQLLDHLQTVSDRRGLPFTIDLSNNTIKYQCNRKYFFDWLFNHKSNMVGFNDYVFVDEDDSPLSIKDFKRKVDKMPTKCKIPLIVGLSLGILFALFIIGMIIYHYKKWTFQRIWFQVQKKIKIKSENDYQNLSEYKAFISYEESQNDLVAGTIIPMFESNEDDKKLRIFDRDCKPGTSKLEFCRDAIENSEKTVVLLTNSYASDWFSAFQFECAAIESMETRQGGRYLIVVVMGELEKAKLSKVMWKWIEMRDYIEFVKLETSREGHYLFLQKLKKAVETRLGPPNFIRKK